MTDKVKITPATAPDYLDLAAALLAGKQVQWRYRDDNPDAEIAWVTYTSFFTAKMIFHDICYSDSGKYLYRVKPDDPVVIVDSGATNA